MNIFESIILGIVQGVGEFLPISSSAHLILIRFLFNMTAVDPAFEKAFDVALHFGTLVAVLFVFYKDWISLFKGAILRVTKKEKSFEANMFFYLVLATIPGALVGFFLEDIIDSVVRGNVLIVAILLAIMGVLIYIGDKWSEKHYKKHTEYHDLTLSQTFLIGMSQALAIIPGFSRSGTTILAARIMGISREAAAKFTFLLSTPIIFGAAVVKLDDLLVNFDMSIIIGVITSAIVGVLSIKFLLKYIKNNDFSIFAYYRVFIALVVIIKLIVVS